METIFRGDRVLLTGATGFVGRYLRPLLEAAGLDVRLASRRPDAQGGAGGTWVRVDVHDEASLATALEGCRFAFYLVHEVGSRTDYAAREAEAAAAFGRAAARADVERVVYLGGVAPMTEPSPHLGSRIETGRLLQEALPTVELRAGMVVGAGGSSWTMVRRAASRLPLIPTPPLLRHHSWPVSVDDTVLALLAALRLPPDLVGIHDIPGPERLRHDALLRRVADLLGHRPSALGLPPLPTGPLGDVIGVVTGIPRGLTRELTRGLGSDLDPGPTVLWPHTGITPTPFDRMVRHALSDASASELPAPWATARIVARMAETSPVSPRPPRVEKPREA